MEAIGEQRASSSAGTDVSGLRAAALLRGRGLRSVSSVGFRSDAAIKDASDGGAAAGFAAGVGFAAPRPGAPRPAPALATPGLEASLALLDSATTAAQEELAAANFHQAADFAELAENLSRRIEYLQLLAAAAVDRTRTEAINAAATASRAAGWTTGWTTEPAPGTTAGTASGPSTAPTAGAESDASQSATAATESSTAAVPTGAAA